MVCLRQPQPPLGKHTLAPSSLTTSLSFDCALTRWPHRPVELFLHCWPVPLASTFPPSLLRSRNFALHASTLGTPAERLQPNVSAHLAFLIHSVLPLDAHISPTLSLLAATTARRSLHSAHYAVAGQNVPDIEMARPHTDINPSDDNIEIFDDVPSPYAGPEHGEDIDMDSMVLDGSMDDEMDYEHSRDLMEDELKLRNVSGDMKVGLLEMIANARFVNDREVNVKMEDERQRNVDTLTIDELPLRSLVSREAHTIKSLEEHLALVDVVVIAETDVEMTPPTDTCRHVYLPYSSRLRLSRRKPIIHTLTLEARSPYPHFTMAYISMSPLQSAVSVHQYGENDSQNSSRGSKECTRRHHQSSETCWTVYEGKERRRWRIG